MKEFIDKLIGRLEEHSFSLVINWEKGKYLRKDKAIEIVNELAEEYINTSTDTSSGWIPCSKRLPEEGKRVLLCTKDKQVCQGERIIFCEHNRYDLDGVLRYCFDDEVIAWQPLPQPYKENKNDKI